MRRRQASAVPCGAPGGGAEVNALGNLSVYLLRPIPAFRAMLTMPQSDCQTGLGGHDVGMTPLLIEVTDLAAHVQFGDAGVGGWPADGELALSVGAGESWRGRLSVSALDEAEVVWARRASADGLTDQESRDVLRVAVDCDAAFYGLAVDWEHARVEVNGSVARVAARVRALPAPWVGLTERRASVVLELVDMQPMYAAWRVEDSGGRLLEERELAVADLAGPDVESMVDRARAKWASLARSAGLSAAEGLSVRLFVSDLEAGSCGELEVSAAVRQHGMVVASALVCGSSPGEWCRGSELRFGPS